MTSFEVARLAQVSQSTVSRALRGDPSIGAETVRRVLAAADQLEYVPSERARSLSMRSTSRIAMVVDLDNQLWPLLVSRIHDELAERGYRLTLIAEHGDPRGIENHLLGGGVDGVILSSLVVDSPFPALITKRGVPAVLLQRYTEGIELDSSVADNLAGGAAAAKMLIEAGHTRIGTVAGPPDVSTARERETGFRQQLDAAGVPVRKAWVREGPYTYGHGYDSIVALLDATDRRQRPTALFCANDVVAIGALNAAHDRGLRVPDDLALVGFDDLDQAAWPLINLSTIRVPFESMLHSAVQMLVERIGGWQGDGRRVIHPVKPVPRGTHGAGVSRAGAPARPAGSGPARRTR